MKSENFGWKPGDWRGAAGKADDNKKSSSNEGRGDEKVPKGAEERAEGVACVRLMGMLEEGKRRVAVGDGGRGGSG